MNNLEKYGTMVVALIGAVTGVWAAYNDFSDSEFKKPITLREANVNSFKSQIASAEARGDKKEVLRVSLEYERYEEFWRHQQAISSITEKITNLVSLSVTPEQKRQLKEILTHNEELAAVGSFRPEALGSAYLATKDFSKANHYFEIAASLEPANANIYALRSLALQGAAQSEASAEARLVLMQQATDLAETAKAKGVSPQRLEALSSELMANDVNPAESQTRR